MNKINILILLLPLSVIINVSQGKNPVLEGPYLGQTPPGLTPKVFAPDIVSTEHRDLSGFFTPNMKEFYFTRKDSKDGEWSLIVFKSENEQWRESIVGPRIGRPIIAPDGKTMHLGKNYMERRENGWSEIKSLGSTYEEFRIMRLSASSKGTYVFDEATRGGNGVLRYSRLIDGEREEPKPLSKEINTGKWNAHPFIAPDESYILWDGERKSGFGNSDIYISFKQPDGSWGKAINLGDKVNTSAEDAGAYITPDGKYLFFNSYTGSGDGDIFWVDAQIIENLRPRS